jgi:hypothetical protein
LLVTTAAVGVLALGTVGPASAALSGPSTATVEVTAGSLAITVPASANLGTKANSVLAETVSGPLGQVQVNDARSGATGWVASVISTTFAPPAGTAIAASAVSYTIGTVTKVGTATHTPANAPNLTGVSVVLSASAVTGDNSATWNPTINVLVPGGSLAAVYTATITHSVA